MDELLNAAPCGFLSFTTSGTILQVNQTLASWLKFEASELQGRSLNSILPLGARIFCETRFWPKLKLQGEIEEVYFSLLSQDKDTVPVLANARQRKSDSDIYDCVFLRVLQRNQYEDELLQAKKDVEKANHAKAEFLSLLSHEFRTPLNAIIGFTDIIASGTHGPVTPKQQEALDQVGKAGDHLLQILSDMLNFVAQDKSSSTTSREIINVNEALREAVALVMPQVEAAGLSIRNPPNDFEITLRTDPSRFQQIVVSLLSNAIQFTPQGGSILLNCSPSVGQVLVQIGDTGIGIPPDQLERIFEPFVKSEVPPPHSGEGEVLQHKANIKQGIGLGLATCRKMARSMGGDLTATSTPGRGSIFTLSLPTS